jgi:hypothetical protein
MFDATRSLFSKWNRPARNQPSKPTRRPKLEELEKRDCPSALQLVSSGVWTDSSIW